MFNWKFWGPGPNCLLILGFLCRYFQSWCGYNLGKNFPTKKLILKGLPVYKSNWEICELCVPSSKYGWGGCVGDPSLDRRRTPALGHTLPSSIQGHLGLEGRLLLLVPWVGGSHSWVTPPGHLADPSAETLESPPKHPPTLISNPILSHNPPYQLVIMMLMRRGVMRMLKNIL